MINGQVIKAMNNTTKTPLRIHYWGPPGAGRSTSIGCVVGGGAGKPLPGDKDHSMELPTGPVILRHSSVATKFFYRAEDPNRPDVVEPALKHLANSSGVVFVVDSQSARSEHNIGALRRLRADLRRYGVEIDELPVVFQLNKRDLPDVADAGDLRAHLQTGWCEYVESVASHCIGTTAAITTLLRMLRAGSE